MSEFSISELLFYGGIAVMLFSAAAAVLSAVAFTLSGRRLRQRLEEEFGKKRH